MSNKKLILAVLLFLLAYGMVAVTYNGDSSYTPVLQHETNTRFLDIKGEYQEGEILIKYQKTTAPILLGFGSNQEKLMAEQLEAAGISSYVKLNTVNRNLQQVQLEVGEPEEVWIKAEIRKDMNTLEVLANLGAITNVVSAEPNYIYYTAEDGTPEVVTDPLMVEQYYLDSVHVADARTHLESMGINPGGSRDVVVAVIDTGVDYLHEDLAPNMWVNTAEIPGNGIDDDNNGIVDDIYGGNFVSDDRFINGNPMDDHGHGTHVAGIIAAKGGNGVGIQGVADNVRIMALKASASSGMFLSADIAEAVLYAYEKGADVINMSFGGYAKSNIVEDALAIAFSRAVLIAAAGNDAFINEPHSEGRDMFPAAYPWVVGVMASSGTKLAPFSNFDYWPEDAHEYSITAPGTFIMSTLPNNKYAKWSGTSMATPIVSGIAALLRSKFTDSGHNSRFIMGQLIGTAETEIEIPEFYKLAYRIKWNTYFQVDALNALTKTPKPNLSYYDYVIWDSTSIDPLNNENGIVDSGELFNLGLFIRNHWGQAKDVEVILDTVGPGGVPDPYLQFVTDTVNYGQVGSFSTDDNGLIYNDEDRVTGVENPFVIRMSPDTPNDYVVRVNVTIKAKNALDPLDETLYIKDKTIDPKMTFTITVRNGVELPNLITEDMTLTNDKFYIISNATRIEDDATVTVEAGTKIQFWSSKPEDPYAETPIAYLRVDGKLLLNGTLEDPIELFPSGLNEFHEVRIYRRDAGQIHMNYTKIQNPRIEVSSVANSYFTQNGQFVIQRYLSGGQVYETYSNTEVRAQTIDSSIFWKLGSWNQFRVEGYVTNSLFDSNNMSVEFAGENNVFLNNFARDMGYYDDILYVSSGYAYNYSDPTSSLSIQKVTRDEVTGKTYVQITNADRFEVAQRFARYLGGHLAVINNAAENDFIRKNITAEVGIGLRMQNLIDGHEWVNGDLLSYTNFREDVDVTDISKPFVTTDATGQWNNSSYSNAWLIEIDGEIYINDIQLIKDYVTLGHDSLPYPIEYTLVPQTASVNDLEWYSMNEAVATVSADGIVTPVSIGSTTIVVKSIDGVITKSVTLNVVQSVALEAIHMVAKEQLNVDDVYKIPYTLTPFNTTELTFDWTSSDPLVATVDNQGRVTAHHTGTVTITATKPNSTITDSVTFNVVQPVLALDFAEDYLLTYVGAEPAPVVLSINPADATNKTIVYTSANPDVAYIDASGMLHAVANGMTVIRAVAEHTNVFAEVTVSVTSEEVANTKFIDIQAMGWYEHIKFYALTETGDVWYWGRNGVQLPTKMTNISNVKQMDMRYDDGLMLTNDGAVYLVQENGEGHNITRMQLDFTDIVKVSRTRYNNNTINLFLRSDGSVWALGANTFGQLPGIVSEELSSVEQLNISGVVDLYAFDHTSVFLKSDGTVHYAGYPNSPNVTTQVDGLSNIVEIDYALTGDYNSPLVTAKDNLNNIHRIRFYDSFAQVEKVIFSGIEGNIKSYTEVNWYHQMVLTEEGKVYSMGYNGYGQLGLGHTQSIYHKFTQVNLPQISKIYASYYNSAAITATGKLLVWGANNYYNLGDHTTKNRTSPIQPLIGFQKDYQQPLVTNLEDLNHKLSVNQNIELIFNEAIKPSSNYMSIKIVDSLNQPISITRKIELNKLIIDPVSPLKYGETYSIIIPNNAIIDYFNNSNSGTFETIETEGGIELVRSSYRMDINDNPVMIVYTTNPEWTEALVFESLDETVVTVDASGMMTPIGLGLATIKITNLSNTYEWLLNIEVINRVPLTQIQINQESLIINKNQTQLLTTTQTPTSANEMLSWSSSDPSIATVDEYGFVKGLKNGTVTITVTSDFTKLTDTTSVTVIEPVTSVTMSMKFDVVDLAQQTYQITANVGPETATDKTLIYESANPAVATVDANGLVTLLQTGTVVIRARANNSTIYDDIYLTISNDLSTIGKIVDIQMIHHYDNPRYYALTETGQVWTWGYTSNVPVKLTSLNNVVSMHASYQKIYFRTSSGQTYYTYYYWGNDVQPTSIDITDVKAWSRNDYNHEYELIVKSDGTVWGRGSNIYGHLAGLANGEYGTFTQLPNLSNIKNVIATLGGAFYLNENGTLGFSGGMGFNVSYQQIYNLPLIQEIAYHDDFWPDYAFIVAKDVNGNYHKIYVWQDAEGNNVIEIQMAEFSTIGETVIDYQANRNNEIAVTSSGKVYVKGNNSYGQLGLGHNQNIGGFTLLDNATYQYAFLMGANGYAVDTTGKLYGWGYNHQGQLGIYKETQYEKPTATMFGFVFDNEQPMIVEQSPMSNEINVNINESIQIKFDEKITPHVNYSNIKLIDELGNLVSIDRKMTLNSIILDPVSPLKYGMTYTVNIPSNAFVDHFGHTSNMIYFTFDTEAGVEFDRTSYKIDINDEPTQLMFTPNANWSDDLVFTSLDESIVTIDQNGLMTPIAVGLTTIQVTNPDESYVWTIQVQVLHRIPITAFDIIEESLVINKGITKRITYSVTPATYNEDIIWTSSDPLVASVDEFGFVKGLKNGTVTITATSSSGAVTDTISITVIEPVESISTTEEFIVVNLNDAPMLIPVTITPDTATDKTVIWESASPEIAYVDENGFLNSVSKGTATIRGSVRNSNLYVEIVVTVSDEISYATKFIDFGAMGYDDNIRVFALTDDGNVWYWGRENAFLPQRVPNLINVIEMSVSHSRASFLTAEGNVYELQPSGVTNYYNMVNTGIDGITHTSLDSYGGHHVLVKDDKTLWAKGNNGYGELGSLDFTYAENFIQIDGVVNAVDAIALQVATVILGDDGNLYYLGSYQKKTTPTKIEGISNVVEIKRSGTGWNKHNFVIVEDQNHQFYTINFSQENPSANLVENGQIDYASDYSTNFDGTHFSVDPNGNLYAKGNNSYGQLGLGHTNHVDQYTQVAIENVHHVYAFGQNAAAITHDGELYIWGRNSSKQIGDLSSENRLTPFKALIGLTVDEQAPMVNTYSPSKNQTNVDVNSEIIIDYTEGIRKSQSFINIQLLDRNNKLVSVEKEVKLDKLIIRPINPLRFGETYKVVVPQNAFMDYFMNQSDYLEFSFTTEDGVKFNKTTYRLDVNDVPTGLNFTVNPEWYQTLTFESLNPAVVNVSDTGILTPLSLGSTQVKITSEDGMYQWTVSVEVIERVPLTALQITEETLTLSAGYTERILFSGSPTNYNEDIFWTSSDTTIASVDEFGFVKGLKNGTVTITATSASGLYSDTISVTVIEPVTSLVFAQPEVILYKLAEPYQLSVTINPSTATNQNIIWTSANPEVATVSSTGFVTPKATGTTVIRARAEFTTIVADMLVTVSDINVNSIDFIDVDSVGNYDYLRVYAVTSTGDVWYWGRDGGQVPRKLDQLSNVKQMSVSNNYAYFLTNDGIIYRVHPNGESNNVEVEETGITNIASISQQTYSDFHTLLVRNDGTVWGKGSNNYGQLAGINGSDVETYVQLQGLANIKTAIALYRTSVFLTTGGQVYYSGTENMQTQATLVSGLPGIESINVYQNYHSDQNTIVAKTTSGQYYRVQFAGNNVYVTAIDLSNVNGTVTSYVESQDEHRLVLTNTGKVYAQGNNYYGQLGDGTRTNSYYQYVDTGLSNVTKIVAARLNSYAITADGDIYMWGYNNYNHMGTTQLPQYVTRPFKILIGSTVKNDAPIITSITGDSASKVAIDGTITIDYNQAVRVGYNFSNIRLYDPFGNAVSIEKTHDFDKIYVKPVETLLYGSNYSLSIPTGAVTSYYGFGNETITRSLTTEDGVIFERMNYKIDLGEEPVTIAYTLHPEWTETLLFSSNNELVATVNSFGEIAPRGVGSATIKVYTSDLSYSFDINVEVLHKIAIDFLTINETELVINQNETKRIIPVVEPANYNEDIIYTSSNTLIASVDEFGYVKGIANGTAVITAKSASGLYSDTITVTVIEPVTSITYDGTIIMMTTEDAPLAIDVEVLPVTATNKNIIWRSTNSNIAYFDNGLLVPVAAGVIIVRAQAEHSLIYKDILVSITEAAIEKPVIVDVAIASRYDNRATIFALDSLGQLWAWGEGIMGISGGIDYKPTPTKLNITGVVDIQSIDGSDHTAKLIALKEDGTIWGIGESGYPSGNGQYSSYTFEKASYLTNITQFSVSTYHTAVIKNDGTVWTWGDNGGYRLGDGTTISRPEPFQISGLTNIVHVSTTHSGTYALNNEGKLFAVGFNKYMTPTEITLPSNFNIKKMVGSGNSSTGYILTTNGKIYYHDYNNNTFNEQTPMIPSGRSIVDLSFAGDTFFTTLDNGEVYAFGSNNYGQLGNGVDYAWRWTSNPTKVALNNIAQIGGSLYNSYAITTTGDLYVWGLNNTDQLANFTNTTTNIPQLIHFGTLSDSQAPTLTQTSISNGAVDVPVTSSFTFTYSEALRQYDNFSQVKLLNSANELISIQMSLNWNVLEITPMTELAEGENYQLIIPSSALSDMFGNPSTGTTINFTTVTSGTVLSDTAGTTRHYWTVNEVNEYFANFVLEGYNSRFYNNAILNNLYDIEVSHWLRFMTYETDNEFIMTRNYWGTSDEILVGKQVVDFDDYQSYAKIHQTPYLMEGNALMYPFVADVTVSTEALTDVMMVGAEMITITVSFNRDMDINTPLRVFFGPDYPFTDYQVPGNWIDAKTWVGQVQITPLTGDGKQYFRIRDAVAADNPWLWMGDDDARFMFEINSFGAEAMNLQATGGEGAVELNWMQDEFDTLAGYNMYRSTALNGFYEKINETLISGTTSSYLDFNVEPGQAYFYKFTIVKTDLTESDFSNVAFASAYDIIPPQIFHTPLSKANVGQEVLISATAYDNIQITSFKLYYRLQGATEYTVTDMAAGSNNRYTGKVQASDVLVPGFEYYLEINDGRTVVTSGSAALPYTVKVQDNPTITNIAPNSGIHRGGTEVTISGLNFKQGAKVYFSTLEGLFVVVENENTIRVQTPAYQPYKVNVTVVNPDGSSHTIYNGYTYIMDDARVVLGSATVAKGSDVQIPVRIEGAQSLLAMDLDMSYDSTALTFVSATKTTMTGRFVIQTNASQSNKILISMASDMHVSGSGDLLILNFKTNAQTTLSSTQLTLNSVSANSINEGIGLVSSTITFSTVYQFAGSVLYYGNNVAVTNVKVELQGADTAYTSTTPLDGTYSFNGVIGGDYELVASKNDQYTAITAYDASEILRYAVKLINLNSSQKIAADVNEDGLINSMDAAMVLQYVAGLRVLPFEGASSMWKFVYPQTSYLGISGSYANQTITAILLGDVSGNYVNNNGQSTSHFGVISIGSLVPNEVGFDVPVYLDFYDYDLYSFETTIHLEDGLTIEDVVVSSELESAFYVVNPTVDGNVKIAVASATPLDLTNPVLTIKVNQATTLEKIQVTFSNTLFNEYPDIVEIQNIYRFQRNFDFNNNGVIDSDDILVFIQHYNKTYNYEDISFFDVNRDGVVDLYDVIMANTLN